MNSSPRLELAAGRSRRAITRGAHDPSVIGSASPIERPKLRIGLIAPPWVAVPPSFYGGTELIVDQLARGFVRAGHSVRLFTTGDATCAVPRQFVFPVALGTTGEMLPELAHVTAAYDAFDDLDVIHDHTLLGPLWSCARPTNPVVVTTAHGEFTPELTRLYEVVGRRVAVVAISHHQRATAPTVPFARVIRHGLDVDGMPFGRGDGGYVLFLGRMSADKGVHHAIAIARAAGRRLLIAAKMWEEPERRYFHECVEPMLGPDVEYLGPVGGDDKWALLAGAEALLNPIQWPEPFGLAMVEALAVGTPVLAYPEGAAPEIIDHGSTGYLCRDEDDMVAKLATVGQLDRQACRRSVEERFSTQRMVDEHLALYARLLRGARTRDSAMPRLPLADEALAEAPTSAAHA